MNTRKLTHYLISMAILAALTSAPQNDATAASVSIEWDPPNPSNGVVGYKLYYGLGSRDYSYYTPVDVGNLTAGVISNLDPSKTYYFAITAYNSSTNESDFSAELVWDNTAPSISGPSTLSVTADQSGYALIPDLTGQVQVSDNFSTAASITIAQSPAANTQVGVGTTVVSLTATDEAGNSSDCAVNLTVGLHNSPPLVSAGANRTISLPTSSIWLNGTVTDDGLPSGSRVSTQWSMTTGPAPVAFADATAIDTSATFTKPGTYVLRLLATDSELSSNDTITITVNPTPIPMPPIGLRVL